MEKTRCPAYNPGWIPENVEDRDEILKEVFDQQMQASKDKLVECAGGCGNHYKSWLMFRCYYCCRYFCQFCAAEHFGKSRVKAIADWENLHGPT